MAVEPCSTPIPPSHQKFAAAILQFAELWVPELCWWRLGFLLPTEACESHPQREFLFRKSGGYFFPWGSFLKKSMVFFFKLGPREVLSAEFGFP